MIAEKDKAAGKDFNKVVHDEMVRAQLDFAELRKIEKANYEEALYQKRRQERETVTIAPIKQV